MELDKINSSVKRIGLIGTLGLVILAITLFWISPTDSIAHIRNLDGKLFIVTTSCFISYCLIVYSLYSKGQVVRGVSKNDDKKPMLNINVTKYPQALREAIENQILTRSFYKERVEYKILVEKVDSSVFMVTELSYSVINVSNEDKEWVMEYKFKDGYGEVLEVKYNERTLDPTLKDYKYGRGLRIPQILKPNEKSQIYFRVREKFRRLDYELYTTYYPSTDLKLTVSNSHEEIVFDYEILYFARVAPVVRGTQKEVFLENGVLPYQGVRLNWNTHG